MREQKEGRGGSTGVKGTYILQAGKTGCVCGKEGIMNVGKKQERSRLIVLPHAVAHGKEQSQRQGTMAQDDRRSQSHGKWN